MVSLLFLLSVLLGDRHLHGIVVESASRRPLVAVTVRVDGTRMGTFTDRQGIFHLHDITSDTVNLIVTAIGYDTARVRVVVTADTRVEIRLTERTATSREITVVGDRAFAALPTQPVAVLTTAELDEHRGRTFSDVLQRIPGVTLLRTGPTISKPVIRGMSGMRLVLRNDGIVQEGQQWGEEHAPEIDPFVPSRISVVKGPAGLLYGPNAMGGVIDVEARSRPTSSRWHGEANVNGFLNSYQGAVSLTAGADSIVGSPLWLTVTGGVRRAGDAATPSYRLNNTGVDEYSFRSAFGVGNDDANVSLALSRFATTLGIYRGSHFGNAEDLRRAIAAGGPLTTSPFSYDITSPRQEILHDMAVVRGTLRLGPSTVLRSSLGLQRNDRSEFDAHNTRIIGRGDDPVERARDSVERLERSLRTPAMNLILETGTLDVIAEQTWSHRQKTQVVVHGLLQTNDRSGSVYLVPDFDMNGLGAAAVHQANVGSLSLSAGLRYDVRNLRARVFDRRDRTSTLYDQQYSGVSGGLGAALYLFDGLTASANFGAAWRPPQPNELYGDDVHHGTARYEVGNTSLRAERTMGFEAALEYDVPGLDVEASLWLQEFDGYIYTRPDPSAPTITVRGTFPTFRQTQTMATIAGLDLSATLAITDNISFYGKGALVRGRDVSMDEPLYLMPADRLRLGIHIHMPDVIGIHDAFVDVGVMSVGRQTRFVEGMDYADPPPGYTTVDLDMGGSVDVFSSTMRVSLSILNVFDRAYRDFLSRFRYFADDAGRDVVLRLSYGF